MAARAPSSKQVASLARSVLTKNLQIRPGERVFIEAWTHALPWAVGFARESRRLGARPILLYEDEPGYWDSVRAGEDALLGEPARHEWAALGATDAYVYFWGPAERTRFRAFPEKRREQLVAYNEAWYDAARKAGLRGVRMELGRVCKPMAELWGVKESRWRNGLFKASAVDPAKLKAAARPLARALHRARSVHLVHANGTDLSLKLTGARPRVLWGGINPKKTRGSYGMMTGVPSGGVLAPLDPRTAEGRVVGNRPIFFPDGRTDGAEFTFRAGKLVHASFAGGEALFRKAYREAHGAKDRPGYLGIGLNPFVRELPTIEDSELGSVLVSIGNSAFLGGKNKSDLFQAALLAGGTLELDGRTIVENGRIV